MYKCVRGVGLSSIKFIDYFYTSRTYKDVYCDNIMCFDIETSSGFLHPTQNTLEPYTGKSQEYYMECEKFALMYIWMFSIDENVFIGRTWDDLRLFLDDLDNIYPFKKIVYVHNLSFDWQFTLNCVNWSKIFAREKRHVMYAETTGYSFRCSYMLTQMKLETWAHEKKLPIKKLVGNLDYNILRTPLTDLTLEELDYCIHDVQVMYFGLLQYRDKYNHIKDIPLTQTGEVRREFQKRINIPKLLKYRQRCCDLIPNTLAEYKELIQIFMGGYTHANYLHTSKVLKGVQSWDISSSYPTVMCLEWFPYTKFTSIKFDEKYMYNRKYSYIICVEFINIRSKKWNSFISESKCIEIRKGKFDNGRVLKADYLSIKLTNIDYELLLKCYEYDEINILEFKIAHNKPLPDEFILYVLELFTNKTSYKNVDEYINTYNQSKQYINSAYGMMVTRLLTDDIKWSIDGWSKDLLNEINYLSKSAKERKKLSKTFTAFQFGVWVTAYARRNIWQAILSMDCDLVYTDTDSVKFINSHDDFFDQYNNQIILKENEVCERLNVSRETFAPKDKFGVSHRMGLFEYEGTYDEFKTLGAKKYCYVENGELHQTVAGVSKSAVAQLKSINDFNIDFEYKYDPTNQPKLLSHYLDNMRPITWNKGSYDEWYSTDKYGICMQPTTYKLGMSVDYLFLLMEKVNNGKTEILQHNPIIKD